MVFEPLQTREENVLSSVIRHFVLTAKPVGSRAIADGMELSAATVRNVLMGLEQKGYLTHPHTSAGRVPVDQGYRFYVDRLMRARQLSLREKQAIEQEFERSKEEVEALLRHAARILSDITRLAGLAVFHAPGEISLDHFKLVSIDSRKVMVILVLGQGWVKEEMVLLAEPLPRREISKIAQILNARFAGLTLSQIRDSLLREVESKKKRRLDVVETVLRLIDGALRFSGEEIRMEGASHLMEQPEFRNLRTMEKVVRLVEEKKPLAQALGRQWSSPGLSVAIGREFPEASMREFSFVHVPCHYQGKVVGALGVLGPTRMAYDRVAGAIRHLARRVEESLELSGV